MTTITAFTIPQMLAQLDGYPDKTVVRINWRDGEFGLLLVEELRAALQRGTVFDRPSDENRFARVPAAPSFEVSDRGW